MKSLNLSKLWSIVLFATMTLCAVSCGNEEEATPQLPDMAVIECSAGDRPEIAFTAQNNWRLSSNKAWCKFHTSGGDFQDISGRAGTQKVKLIIGNEQIKDSVTEAEITIIMGGHKAIIARILRAPDKFYLKIYDITQTSTNGVVKLGYDGYIPMIIEANFNFAAVEYPEWVEIRDGSISGVAGEQVEAYVRIVPNGDRERYPIAKEEGFVMVFSDPDRREEKTFVCPIVYEGMGNKAIAIYGPTENEFGWEVTPDGKSFSQVNDADETVTYQDKLEYNIVANNDVFHIVYVDSIIDRGIPSFEVYSEDDKGCWMHFDKLSMSLTVEPSTKIRAGYVMAFPKETYNFVLADLKNGILFERDNSSGIDLPVLRNDYLKYVVASLTQYGTEEADPATQMHIYHSITAYDIPAMRYTDSAVMAQYGVSEAYIAPFINSIPNKQPYIVINPRIDGWSSEEWINGDTGEAGMVGVEVWYKGAQLSMSKDEYYVGENVDELLSLHLYGPRDGFEIGGENIYVVFKLGGEAKKLLVVTPPTK